MADFTKSIASVAILAASACGDPVEVQGVAIAQADAANPVGAVHAGNRGTADGALAVASAYCTRLFACQPHDAAIDYTNANVCTQRELLRITKATAAAGASTSSAILTGCAVAIAAATCDAVHYGGPPRCYFAAGGRPSGKACAWDSQCQGKVCVRKGAETCGTCGSEGQAGDTCSPGTCTAGLACVFDEQAKKFLCRPRSKVGEPCNAGVKYEPVCGYGLVCDGAKCAPAGALASPCPAGGCDHDLGLDCHKQTKVCTAIPMGAAGASCSVNGIGHDLFKECQDGLCLNRNDMGNGTCMAYAADGGKCGAWSGPACRVPAVCVAGVCTVLDGGQCP